MAACWRDSTLDEVCIRITDGAHASPKSVECGLPMASVKDMTSYGLNLQTARQIAHADFAKLVRQGCKPVVGDVLIAKDGATALDTVCIIKHEVDVVLLSSVAILRPNADVVLPAFLRYYLDAEPTRAYMKAAFTTGAAIPRVVLKDFKRACIRYPSLDAQALIVSILSAYDDLIENNTRRIAILEEMARRIYEEWFVRFRYPGHEDVRMVESELGLVPDGWQVVTAAQAIEINPTTKVPKAGLKPFLPMNCLSDGSMLIGSPGEREGNSGSKFRNGDTLFARITPCLENGKTGFVQFLPDDEATAFGSTEFIVLRSRTLTPEFVYLLARSEPFRENAIKSMSGASGRQRVREACFDSFLMVQPTRDTLSRFQSVVRPMFKLAHALALKNANLRTTRDLLLPKLISGELDVSELILPEAIAA